MVIETDAKLEYVGFWIRVVAALIDTALVTVALWPLGHVLYRNIHLPSPDWDPNAPGALELSQLSQLSLHFSLSDVLLGVVLPAAVVIVFWIARQATPGKMVFGARIVDAISGRPPHLSQMLVRYLGYYLSTLFLCLGFIWVGLDPRKQGWHDKLANTVVVRHRRRIPLPPAQ
ncbi:MAG: RDD family protein [Steroidobacteraceae bacterium]|jgi:uncharacterized RDD family membrane protein YckC